MGLLRGKMAAIMHSDRRRDCDTFPSLTCFMRPNSIVQTFFPSSPISWHHFLTPLTFQFIYFHWDEPFLLAYPQFTSNCDVRKLFLRRGPCSNDFPAVSHVKNREKPVRVTFGLSYNGFHSLAALSTLNYDETGKLRWFWQLFDTDGKWRKHIMEERLDEKSFHTRRAQKK